MFIKLRKFCTLHLYSTRVTNLRWKLCLYFVLRKIKLLFANYFGGIPWGQEEVPYNQARTILPNRTYWKFSFLQDVRTFLLSIVLH